MLLDQHKSHLIAKLPWTPLVVPSARKFQIKKLFGPDYYLILVTNLRNVWLEHVQTTDIYARARESEIAVVEGDSDRLAALIKILSTFLDNVQEIRESSDKLEIICTRQVGFARVPWSFRCAQMTSSGSTQNALDGPDTLYKHLIGPTLALGGTYQQFYLQQRQQLIALDQEVSHLYDIMTKAGLGTPGSRRTVTNDSEELKSLKKTIEEQAVKRSNMPSLLATSTTELLITATESTMMASSLEVMTDSSGAEADASASPIQDDLIMAAGLHSNLQRKGENNSASTIASMDDIKSSSKTNKEKEHEKRAALREALAQEGEKRQNKKKRLL